MRYILALFAVVLFSSAAYPQVSITFGNNVAQQPIWGPTGYDHVEYYYIPAYDVYYFVPKHKYFYADNGVWKSGSSLPSRFRGFDPYRAYKVVVNEPTPYRNNAVYKEKYSQFKDRQDQESIRDSKDSKYFVNAKHPEHKNWANQQKQNNNSGKKHGKK